MWRIAVIGVCMALFSCSPSHKVSDSGKPMRYAYSADFSEQALHLSSAVVLMKHVRREDDQGNLIASYRLVRGAKGGAPERSDLSDVAVEASLVAPVRKIAVFASVPFTLIEPAARPLVDAEVLLVESTDDEAGPFCVVSLQSGQVAFSGSLSDALSQIGGVLGDKTVQWVPAELFFDMGVLQALSSEGQSLRQGR